MSQKLHSKLLSVILCIAICCATLCGSIIAANAAQVNNNGTYTITVGDEKQAVPFAATEVKAQVKFDLPAGIAGGQFTALAQDTYTIGKNATIVAATDANGNELTADEISEKTKVTDEDDVAAFSVVTKDAGSNKCIRFVLDGTYKSITIEYTISLTDYVKESTDAKYPVSIELSDDDLEFFATYAEQAVTFDASPESDTSFHAHSAWYDITSLSDVNGEAGGLKNVQLTDAKKYIPINTKDGKHTIASGTCTVCKEVNSSASYYKNVQVIPDYTEFDGKTTTKNTTGWCGISGVTVRYNENGGLDVDVHVYSQYRSGTVDLLICDTEGNELYRLPCVADGTSYFAGNGFPAAEKVFTITGLSASNIETELLLTLAEYGDGTNVWFSRTMPFCLADYCQKVVEGNGAIWADGATEAQIEADKDVAAALYYYGAAIDESVFDKNTSGGSGSSSNTVNYINKSTVVWDGEYASDYPVSGGYSSRTDADKLANFNAFENSTSGSGDSENDPYIITTVEQFIYVSQLMGTYSQNKYFKVDDSVGIFDLGTWADGTPHKIGLLDNSSNFYGNFDGNGVEFTSLVFDGYHSALFPNVNSGATIKNIKLTGATITATQQAAGIIANVNGGTATIDGCVVINCSMSGGGTAGALAGTVGNNNSLVVNNCFVSNNTVTTTNASYRSNHIIGAGAWGTGTLNVNNSIVLVNDVYYWNVTCKNVYSDEQDNSVGVASTGSGAVATMNLGDAWFDTSSYPELKAYHTFGVVCVDETKHETICLHKIDGVSCKVSLGSENHTLLPNDARTENVCNACGYSEEIIGNTITPNNKIKVTWDGTKPENLAASGITGSGTDKDPYIIETPAQLWYVAQLMNNDSAGKYFKVADNIAVFDMCGSNYSWSLKDSSSYFQGNFDGNGVEIINLVATGWNIGLFPYVKGNVTFSNLKVTGANLTCSGTSYAQVGVIYGVSAATSITFDNCHISDCVLSATGTNPTMGILGSASSGAAITINDCFLSSETTVNPIGYVNTSGHSVNNVILINGSLNNNYTTQNNVYTASTAVTGDGAVVAMNLGDAWFDTASYPELDVFHDMITIYVDENTHKSVCQHFVNGTQCTTCGPTEEHTLIKNAEGTANVCSCGYYEEINGNTITPNNKIKVAWDGSMPANLEASGITGGGTSTDPYIIKTPAQLYYVVQKAVDASVGKYYEIDKDIAVFDMAGKNWSSANSNFQGHLNGNGVEIINLKTTGWDTGLIPRAYGATIENIKVTGATIEGNSGGDHAGVLVGNVTGGTVTLNGCVVVDSTINADDYAGALIGVVGNNQSAAISNCFVSNNTVTSRNSTCPANRMIGGGGWGTGKITVDSTIVIGNDKLAVSSSTKLYDSSSAKTGSGAVDDMGLDSSVWFDTASYPELHVFHDMATVTIDANTHQYVCQIFINGTQCTTCRAAVSHTMVDSEDGKSSECECGYGYEIKGIHAMGLPTSILNRITSNATFAEKFATNALFKAAYNEDVFGTQVQANVFDMYTTSLNLKVNPHIGFMFAFHNEYKTNRSKITVTFTVDGQTYTTEAVETNGTLGTNWVNNSGAGRYHLYRFKELPVSKLCKDVKVTVNYNGADYDFGTYSAAGYAINAMNAGEDYQYHVNASMALVYYSEMLAARAGK